MTRLYAKVLIICLSALLLGCDKSTKTDIVVEEYYDLDVSFFDKELADTMASELDKREIKYIREGDLKIRYLVSNSQAVTNLVYEINMNDLPSNRSVNLTSGVSNKQFESALDKAGIEYVVKHRKGEKWIVWSEEKESEGRALLNKILKLDEQRIIEQVNG